MRNIETPVTADLGAGCLPAVGTDACTWSQVSETENGAHDLGQRHRRRPDRSNGRRHDARESLAPRRFARHDRPANAPYGTAKAAVRNISGIVHFRGAISTSGTDADPFILPAGFRPAKDVFIPVDLCNGDNGRLDIQPDGVVTVEAENSDFAQAQCFTSLDGASFAR